MHTNRVKAKVDFKFCMGNIPAMLRATKPVLSEKQYKELCNEVNKADGYLEQKRIIFSYVDPIIKVNCAVRARTRLFCQQQIKIWCLQSDFSAVGSNGRIGVN